MKNYLNELDETIYALDSTTIDLCMSLFPWAKFRKTKSAIKLHTLLNLQNNIPAFIHITDGSVHDVNILDVLITEVGAYYIIDKGYIDYERLYSLNLNNSYFVTRAKSNMKFRRIYSNKVDKSIGLICDQTIVFTNYYSAKDYPDKIRRIKSFFGNSANAVKTQVWIAISVYVLLAIVKKHLKIDVSLYTFLQVISISIFEKTPIFQLFQNEDYKNDIPCDHNQLFLFDL